MKKIFQRLPHFEWLGGQHAARLREAVLHGVSFGIALILIAAGHGQLVANPFWSAFILASFGAGYAIAAGVFKEAGYVYPTLALWTFAFFMVCYGIGMAPLIFPPVATIVIWLLWMTAGNANRNPQFNTAIYRGVFLSTVFFARPSSTFYYHLHILSFVSIVCTACN